MNLKIESSFSTRNYHGKENSSIILVLAVSTGAMTSILSKDVNFQFLEDVKQ